MEMRKIDLKEMEKLYLKAYDKNGIKLVNWANKKFSTKDLADEYCQEVVTQFYISICKKHQNGDEIKNIDKYLWQIALNIYANFAKQSKAEREMLKILQSESPISTEDADVAKKDFDSFIDKIRKAIPQLNNMHRKVAVKYYIENKKIKEISQFYDITESYTKKLLHESRQIILNEEFNMSYDMELFYSPVNLSMTFSGESLETPDFVHVANSLSKQNICVACYQEPKNIDGIAKDLGLPKAYIEFDLEWLLQKEFIIRKKDKYYTNFFIIDGELKTLITNIYMKYKKDCIDTFIDKIISKQKIIKDIGFIGCDKPIEKLLWFLIYTFTDMASDILCKEKFNYNFNSLNRIDGGKYYPIGVYDSESQTELDPLYSEKYKSIKHFKYHGTYNFNDGGSFLSCLNIHQSKQNHKNKLTIQSLVPAGIINKDILFKVMHKDFNISELPEDDKYKLSQLIKSGYLSKSNENDTITPNFCVFTPKQKKTLDNILNSIFNEIKPIYQKLFKEIHDTCTANIPLQLDNMMGYITHYFLNQCHDITNGTAFLEDKIYKPETDSESTALTTCMVYAGKKIDNNIKYYLNFKIIVDKK